MKTLMKVAAMYLLFDEVVQKEKRDLEDQEEASKMDA